MIHLQLIHLPSPEDYDGASEATKTAWMMIHRSNQPTFQKKHNRKSKTNQKKQQQSWKNHGSLQKKTYLFDFAPVIYHPRALRVQPAARSCCTRCLHIYLGEVELWEVDLDGMHACWWPHWWWFMVTNDDSWWFMMGENCEYNLMMMIFSIIFLTIICIMAINNRLSNHWSWLLTTIEWYSQKTPWRSYNHRQLHGGPNLNGSASNKWASGKARYSMYAKFTYIRIIW